MFCLSVPGAMNTMSVVEPAAVLLMRTAHLWKRNEINKIILVRSIIMLPQLADEHNAEGSPRLGRPFYEQEQLNTELNYTKPSAQNSEYCVRTVSSQGLSFVCVPEFHRRGVSGRGVCHFLASMFPVVGWLSRYKFRRDIVGDLVSGCTVAVMHIPQGTEGLVGGVATTITNRF